MSYSTIQIVLIVAATIGLVASAIVLFGKRDTTLHKHNGNFFTAGILMICAADITTIRTTEPS